MLMIISKSTVKSQDNHEICELKFMNIFSTI